MRRTIVITIVLWLSVGMQAMADGDARFDGVWKGVVQTGGEDVRVVLHVNSSANGNSATVDSPDRGKIGTRVDSLRIDGELVEFAIKSEQGAFHGKLSADHNQLAGEWKTKEQSVAITFTRMDKAPSFESDGSYLFHTKCTSCHAPFNPIRAPWPNTLRLMPLPEISKALESGKMKAVGAELSGEQRASVASYLGRRGTASQTGQANLCGATPPMANNPLWNGWGADLSNSRFQPEELAGLERSQISRLRVKWAFGYPRATSAGGPPTIIGDRMFVAGGDGRVYALDMHTGCTHWTFLPSAPARTAISVSPDGRFAYFGDMQGRVYGVDISTGALLWKTEIEQHPFAMITGAPKLYEGRLYVPVSSAEELGGANPKYACCTFRGSVGALDAKTGKLVWKTYLIDATPRATSKNAAGTEMLGPSGAAVWNSPTIDPDRRALYVGTGDNYSDPGTTTSDAVMAIRLEDGKILWAKQLTGEDRFNVGCMAPDKSSCPKDAGGDFDVGAPPILRKLRSGKSLLLVGQKSGVAYGLDPDEQGKIVWQSRIGKGGVLGGIEFGGAADADKVYFPLSDWAAADAKAGGGVFALDLATGKKVWAAEAPTPDCLGKEGCGAAQPAPATAIAGVVFSGSLDGHIRAYDAADGKVIWDFNTATDFKTVNQLEARGGSINYAGPVVAGGMVFVTSGYSVNSGMAGNVLLAFSVDGK